MRRGRYRTAFTLAELLVTLIVTGILLSALATLAFALSSATCVEDETLATQAQLRQGTLRLQELVGNCRMICVNGGFYLAIWRADDNDDGQINVNELVYLDTGDGGSTLERYEFASTSNPTVTLTSGSLSMTKWELIANHNGTLLPLIPDARSVAFAFDTVPPATQHLTVSFTLTENGVVRPYQIDIALRAWAGHLLDVAGDSLVGDDDE